MLVASPHDILAGSPASLAASGNVYLDTTGPREVRGTAFSPPYEYRLDLPLAALATDDIGPR
jgi:hypothetical protein